MSKRIAISQSNYIPWKGYFDSIAEVDEWMLYDDMQYTRRDWRNRNQIKTSHGLEWISIPVIVKGKYTQSIKETKVSDKNWNKDHWNLLKQNYAKAPAYMEVKDFIENLYHTVSSEYLSEINHSFLLQLMEYLGIKTLISKSSDYDLVNGKTERLVNLCKLKSATDYYSGKAAQNYMDLNLFAAENIDVHWFDHSGYSEYPQLFPPFTHQVSIIDLLFNEGKNASKHMKFSKTKESSHE
jgi:hypothetical protein